MSYVAAFLRCFARHLEGLTSLEQDGLVEVRPDWIVVTPRGRLLVRAVCAVFDRYLRQQRERPTYSKVI